MSGTINWKKKNGNTMEANDLDETIKYMESIGAVRVGEKGEVDTAADLSEKTDSEPPQPKKFKKMNSA